MKILTIVFLLSSLFVFSFALQIGTLTASPIYALPGDNFKLTLSATLDVKNVLLYLYNSHDDATETLSPQSSGNIYVWNYASNQHCDFRAKARVTLNSTDIPIFSNTATFTTDIPAASVNSTIVYVPFITDAAQTWKIDAKNIGSKPLEFSAFSSPSGLSILPVDGSIQPQNVESFNVSDTGFFLPGQIYVLDAFLDTNDPRENMERYLLSRVIEGPDGLVVTPVQISHSCVSMGSDVKFGFSVLHHNVVLNYIYVFWDTPRGSKIFNLSVDKDHVSSTIRTTSTGIYKLSHIIINYTHKGVNKELTLSPNLQVKVVGSSKTMKLNLADETRNVGILVNSSSSPTVYALDGSLTEKIVMNKENSTWVGTYSYKAIPGPVTIYATFDDVHYVISRTFERFSLNGEASLHFDGGWVNIPNGAFEGPTMVSIFSEPLSESLYYYKGYSNFNRVSNAVTLVSTSEMSTNATYHLQFNVSMVNGLLDNLRVYELQGKNWGISGSTPTVDGNMVSFFAKKGTYALSLIPQISNSSNPNIKSLAIVPRKLNSLGSVRFFLSVDKDCYYHLMIYDMRGRIVASQKGEALRRVANLLYILNPIGFSNGMYVAVVGAGPSPSAITETVSKSFAIIR